MYANIQFVKNNYSSNYSQLKNFLDNDTQKSIIYTDSVYWADYENKKTDKNPKVYGGLGAIQYLSCFKWADVGYTDGNEIKAKLKKDRGMEFNQHYVKSYLDDLNIHAIISGHQDNINFGTLPLNGDNVECGMYDLKCHDVDFNDNKKFILPSDDTLMVITSSAVNSKYNPYLDTDTYLILEKKK